MFIRKLKSPNGKIYIQVVDKSSGKYKVVKSFGCSSNIETAGSLIKKAQDWLNKHTGLGELDFSNTDGSIAENIFEVAITLPQTGKIKTKTLLLTDEQKLLNSIFQFGC